MVDRASPFYVPPTLDLLGRIVNRYPRFWTWLGQLESQVLASQLAQQKLARPIYVCGLARSGSTLLHEVLCSHPHVATHRIKDYPFITTPYWWRRATLAARPTEARERPHRDKMMVTPDSPDSIEEMLWMAFFPGCHDPKRDNRLIERDRQPAFDSYYLNHLRKLLFVEKATYYVAKANYHIARLEYLANLFPEARFVIPIRTPLGHISSLARQHDWFSAGQRQSPRALAFMQRSGHFEFGLDRRPVNLGDQERVDQIQSAWGSGHEIAGWALYWEMVYRYLADLLESQPAIRKAAIVVRFEELCDRPADILEGVLQHCELRQTKAILEKYAPTIQRPNYYKTELSSQELTIISSYTSATAERWGLSAEGVP